METAIQNWGHQNYHSWTPISGSTMGAAQFEDEEVYDDPLSRSYEHTGQAQDVTMVVSCDLEGAKSDRKRQCQAKRIYYRSKYLIDYLTAAWKNFIVYEGLEDYSGFQGETVTTLRTLPDIFTYNEYEEHAFRGIYSPKYKRNVIFTKTLQLKTSELPRWKPTAIIGKRDFEEEDAQ